MPAKGSGQSYDGSPFCLGIRAASGKGAFAGSLAVRRRDRTQGHIEIEKFVGAGRLFLLAFNMENMIFF